MSCCNLVGRIEEREMAAYYLTSNISFQPLRAPVPCRHYPRFAKTENRILANRIDKEPECGVAFMSPFPVRGEAVAGCLSIAVHLDDPMFFG
jgi:hypothetical protein